MLISGHYLKVFITFADTNKIRQIENYAVT